MPCRKIAVDVRVHSGQRELDRQDAGPVAAFEQRPPRRRRAPAVGVARGDRVEIQIREHDVELLEKCRIAKRRRRHRAANRQRHPQVQAIEPPQPVAPGQLALERRHDLHDLVDGRRAAAPDSSLSIHSAPPPGARTSAQLREQLVRRLSSPCRRRDSHSSAAPGTPCRTPTPTSGSPSRACADPR